MTAVTVLLGLLIAGLVYAYFKLIYRKVRPGEPPLVPGHFLFGNGNQFREHAVRFLSNARKTYGDVFTIRFLNLHLTMVLDTHSYELVAREKNFDFKPIQKQVNGNVFGFKLKHAKKMLSQAGQKVNGKYLFQTLENFARSLAEAFNKTSSQIGNANNEDNITRNNNIKNSQKTIYDEELESKLKNVTNNGQNSGLFLNSDTILEPPLAPTDHSFTDSWGQDYLRNFASKIFFSPIFYTIFGREAPGKEGTFHPQVFHKTFDQFHKYFNLLWVGLPIKFFPKAVEAAETLLNQPFSSDMILRDGCSDYIKFSTQFMLDNEQTERDITGHNLVFLHVNYNTFRVAYWCMYKLMEDAVVMDAVKREVEEVIEAKRSGTESEYEAEFTTEDINSLPIVDSFLKEIIRMTSGVFMVRACTVDTRFTTASGQSYNIRKGDRVAIYPPVFHHDPDIFEDPETFKYDRFVDAVFYKNGVKVTHPLIAFGSLCPGQKLSLLQLKWFIINLLNSFKIELLEGEKTAPDTTMYGHEILPPENDVQCRFMPRERACALKYINNYGSNGSKGLDGISYGNVL